MKHQSHDGKYDPHNRTVDGFLRYIKSRFDQERIIGRRSRVLSGYVTY